MSACTYMKHMDSADAAKPPPHTRLRPAETETYEGPNHVRSETLAKDGLSWVRLLLPTTSLMIGPTVTFPVFIMSRQHGKDHIYGMSPFRANGISLIVITQNLVSFHTLNLFFAAHSACYSLTMRPYLGC